MNTNLTPLIGDYVAGKLEGKVLAEFEARMKSDAAFAALIEEARKKHEQEAALLTPDAPKSRPMWIPVAAGVVGVAMFAWMVSSIIRAVRAPDVPPTTEEVVATEPDTAQFADSQPIAETPASVAEVPVTGNDAVATSPSEAPAPATRSAERGASQSSASSPRKGKAMTVAARTERAETPREVIGNYTPNPTLASKLDIVHDGEFRVKHSVTSRRDTVTITAEGAATFEGAPDPTFVYKVYSNRPTAFKQNKPVFQQVISFSSQGSDGYEFSVSKKIFLKPGLYYAVIEQGSNRKIVWSDEIEIEHFN